MLCQTTRRVSVDDQFVTMANTDEFQLDHANFADRPVLGMDIVLDFLISGTVNRGHFASMFAAPLTGLGDGWFGIWRGKILWQSGFRSL